jgi:CDP-4-dehydro-6-deoxyglucose reductase, E1
MSGSWLLRRRLQDFRYPLATTTWDDAEISAMRAVIEAGNFTMGSKVRAFEAEFAKFFGAQHAVMSNSGSSANLLAISAIRYSSHRPGSTRDEVIVPAVSWSTTYYPITQLGFKLKFVDVDLQTLNAPIEYLEKAVDERTAGIVIVNLLGNPADLPKVRELCDSKGLFLIEDNCESLGAQVDGKFAGTFGDIGTFSSFFSHHISTMEGGLSVTSDLELAQVMTSIRAHGWTRELPEENYVFAKSGDQFEDSFRFVLPGYNLRPLELEGAIGLEQLKKVHSIIEGRRSNSAVFKIIMEQFPNLSIQRENGVSSWFGFSILLTGPFEGRRKELVGTFESFGIACRPVVAGNFTRNPVMKHLPHVPLPPLPNSNAIHENGLFIGNHHYSMESEFQVLEDALRAFHGDFKG